MSSNSYLKHYIQTQSWLKNRNAWVLSLWFFLASGVLWLLKGKPNGAWYWLNRNQLLFTFCGICITSNSTKRSTTRTNLSPLTFFLWNQWVPSDSLQNTQAYTCLFLVHKSSTWSEKAEGFGFNCFDFIFIIYILWDMKVSYNTCIKMGNIMAHKRWATFTLLSLSICYGDPSPVWRQTLKYNSAKPLFNG